MGIILLIEPQGPPLLATPLANQVYTRILRLVWMYQGNLANATIWGQDLEQETSPVEQLGASLDAPISHYHLIEPAWIALARLRILQDKLQDAQDLLDKLLGRASRLERWGSVLQINILQAMSHDRQSNPKASLEALHHALRLTERGGHMRVFLDEGAWMEGLQEL